MIVTWLAKSIPVTLVALVLQLELFSSLRVMGVMPELLLGLTVAAAWWAGPERGALLGFVAGALYDLYLPTPLALSALTYTLVGYGVGLACEFLAHNAERLARYLLGTAAVTCGLVLFVTMGELLGEENLYSNEFPKILAVATVYTGLLLPVLHLAMRWASAEPGAVTRDELGLLK